MMPLRFPEFMEILLAGLNLHVPFSSSFGVTIGQLLVWSIALSAGIHLARRVVIGSFDVGSSYDDRPSRSESYSSSPSPSSDDRPRGLRYDADQKAGGNRARKNSKRCEACGTKKSLLHVACTACGMPY